MAKDEKTWGITMNTNGMPRRKNFLWRESLGAGCHWSGLVRRGMLLRLIAVGDGANVSALFYQAPNFLERYNMADTLKAQHTACLTTGNVLMSDMGRVICSLVTDTCGWNDPLCAPIDAEQVRAKWGEKTYQQAKNQMYRNARDGLLIELGKYGLGPRDLTSGVNFFSKVVADTEGKLQFHSGHSKQGQVVELRMEMDTLVVLSSAPHALDPSPQYSPQPVDLELFQAPIVERKDVCVLHCPENTRAFENTWRFYDEVPQPGDAA